MEGMRKQWIALIVAASSLAAVSAQAQTKPLGALIRAGIFSPTDSDAGNLGQAWFTGGVELGLGRFPLFKGGGQFPGKWSLSGDAYSKAGASAVPITLNYIQYTSSHFFWNVGLGGALAHRPNFEDSFELAYQVGVGYDLGGATPVTFQVRFFSVNNVGSFLDGFAFTVGLRL
jgi:hypothetical protein